MDKTTCHKLVKDKFAKFSVVEQHQAIFEAYKMEKSVAKEWIIEWLNENYPDTGLLAYCDLTYNSKLGEVV